MSNRGNGKGNCLVWIIIVGVLVFGLLKFGKHLQEQRSQGPAAELKTPSDATRYYIRMVRRVKNLNPDDVGIDELLGAVTKSDKKWYYDNQDRIYDVRHGSFDKFIGLQSQQALVKNIAAMMSILEDSPDREDALISNEQISSDGKQATVEVAQGTALGGTIRYTVQLQKEGGLWKVSGFCGARETLERELAAAASKKGKK